MIAEDWAARLASGVPVPQRVAIVVAHPDDETLWTGSLLPRLADALLIHVTDGAPLDMEDAHRLGFTDRAAYAAVRDREIDAALARLGATPARKPYGVTDKTAALDLPGLASRIGADIATAALVITHPYEGGHPDHDAVAWAVAAACRSLAREPAHVEFACYHEADDQRRFGHFWPGTREFQRSLEPDEQARVAHAIAEHRTQAGVIGDWRPARETWRAAPRYDFTAAPPPGRALYDRFGWGMTSERFSTLAAQSEMIAC